MQSKRRKETNKKQNKTKQKIEKSVLFDSPLHLLLFFD